MKALYIRIYLPYLILKCIFFKYVYFQVSYYNKFTSVHNYLVISKITSLEQISGGGRD
jgi:hypothetical protein